MRSWPTAPATIRLVFSEPIDPAGTPLDLLDSNGRTIVSATGAPDAADPYSLVAPVPNLADGIYTVQWRALSAADGHTTSGFLTFGVGDVSPPPAGGSASGAGDVHAGHDAATTFLETESRVAGDLGLMLSLGISVFAWLVLRDPRSSGAAKAVTASLGIGAFGAAGLLALGAAAPGVDPLPFVTGSRIGQLLALRVGVTTLAAATVLAMIRRRPSFALVIGGLAGLGGIALVAIGGHAAAYAAPAPTVAIIIHVAAAGIWVAGVGSLAWLAIVGAPDERPIEVLVPRFSALALVAVGLIALSGIYSDWIQTRELVSWSTPYGGTLVVKMVLALAAFALGAVNLFSGGRDHDRRFRLRVAVEAGLALAVLIATGVLASGSPTGQVKPIGLAPVVSNVDSTVVASTLELAPGRPGPTRFIATVAPQAVHVEVELQLQRLDAGGSSRIELRSGAVPWTYEASGGLLPAGSRWDASIIVRSDDGRELARTRFAFAMDATGVSEGRASPAVDVGIAVSLGLLAAAALGLAFGVGGGRLPRADRDASRVAVVAGSLVAGTLGATILLLGPRL